MWSDIWTLLGRELRIELRTREVLSAMLVFGILVLIVFTFSFPPSRDVLIVMTPGILWVSFIFSGFIGFNRSIARDLGPGRGLLGILASPVDRGALFVARMLANLIFLTLLQIVIMMMYALFFNVDLSTHLRALGLVIILGTLGFVALGTLFSTIAAQTRFQDVLLPVLLLPLVSPVVIGAVKATAAVMGGTPLAGISFWIRFLGTFDAVFIIVSFLTYEFVVQE